MSEFNGSAGVSPQEAASGFMRRVAYFMEQEVDHGDTTVIAFAMSEQSLKSLGFRLAMLKYVWEDIQQKPVHFYIAMSPGFRADDAAMEVLRNTASYIALPKERLRTLEEMLQEVMAGELQKFWEESDRFMEDCAERRFKWGSGNSMN